MLYFSMPYHFLSPLRVVCADLRDLLPRNPTIADDVHPGDIWGSGNVFVWGGV
jgi:hypothetical protein